MAERVVRDFTIEESLQMEIKLHEHTKIYHM